MATDLDHSFAEKHSIIKELFIATADDNYVTARWCYHEDLNIDFFWLAVHCLEKYLKAALLMNGRPVLTYQHEVVRLYAAVKPLAPELLPHMLAKPDDMPTEYWLAESVEDYVRRLYRNGRAHNRYQLYGYARQPEDLWKLDQVVFSVRRLCQPLEAHFLGRSRDGVPDESVRERMIKDHPLSSNLYSKLEDAIAGKRGETLRRAALTWNFPFAPKNTEHPPMSYVSASHSPVLVRRLCDPLEAGPQNFAPNDALWDWVKTNIYIPPELTRKIEAERSRLKAKAYRASSGARLNGR